MDDESFGVPAGWYPDPLGLPQLRWWDAQAWTEHTSEARAPIVIQPASAATPAAAGSADSEQQLPSRREQRERERRESAAAFLDTRSQEEPADEDDELSAQPLLEMTLRELEPPLTDTVDDATPGPRRATFHANVTPGASTLSAMSDQAPPEREIKKTRTYTVAVWAIAIMPLLQVSLSIVLLVVLGIGGNVQLMVTIWLFPYLIVIGFAFYDRLVLQVWGHRKPATGFWAILTAPTYLIARARRTHRETGKGFAPLILWCATAITVLGAVVALPGLVISLFPSQFAHEIEQSVTADAAILGADLTVDCPTPALIIGDTMSCLAEKPSGATDSIDVILQRQNGWITWRVTDWGDWVLAY